MFTYEGVAMIAIVISEMGFTTHDCFLHTKARHAFESNNNMCKRVLVGFYRNNVVNIKTCILVFVWLELSHILSLSLHKHEEN